MTTTQPNQITVKGTHGWTYEFKAADNKLRFIRWNDVDGREYHGRVECIELGLCDPVEVPTVVRGYLASFSTAGERVKAAAVKLAIQNC